MPMSRDQWELSKARRLDAMEDEAAELRRQIAEIESDTSLTIDDETATRYASLDRDLVALLNRIEDLRCESFEEAKAYAAYDEWKGRRHE